MELSEIDPQIIRHLKYLSFKADCMREQQENPLRIDRKKAQGHLDELQKIIEEKTQALIKVMPKKPVIKKKPKPKVMQKADGSMSSNAKKWYTFLLEQGLPRDTEGEVSYVSEYKDGNPNGPQLKDWLFELGWEPCTFKFDRNKLTGEERKIPQVRYFSPNDPRKGELTESVVSLIEKEPALEALGGLSMATHRAGIFKAFLENSDENSLCVASAGGLTNTMRFKHRNPFVNMPKADGETPWGVEIRGCIIAPEGFEMCGSDVVSLEATTKRHYMYPHDPDYADAMGVEGFDEHLDLATHAGALTEEEIEEKGKSDPSIKSIRKQYKATNYSAIYGVGPPKLARELFIKQAKAVALLAAYWERNWSIKEVAKEQYVKVLKDGSMWLKNPVSGLYYSLRYEKDIFSTLNQGTGVFIFDSWLRNVREAGIKVPFQYHDELMVLRETLLQTQEQVEDTLVEAMDKVNESLGLHVDVSVDTQWGENYAAVH